MKKFVLLFMIFLGVPLHSQVAVECESVQISTQINSSTCPEAPSLTVDVIFFPSEYNIQFVVLKVTNLSTFSERYIEFPNPDPSSTEILGISQLIGQLIPGDEYELEAIIYTMTGEVICPVFGSPLIIPECSSLDQDRDSFTADVDCDDRNSSIYPDATEICNFKDDNCDGIIDEGVNYTYFWDDDDDGYGDASRPIKSCSSTPTNKLSINSDDCDDTNAAIYPGATEECDGIDNNCDGTVDEQCSCPDDDNDGVCNIDDICSGFDDTIDGDSDGVPDGCDNCPSLINPNQDPDGDCDGVPTGEDCNDNDATVTTSNINDADCDGVPTAEDCDDTDSSIGSNVNDADCDGVPTGEDCNDGDATITTSNLNDADCDGVPTAEDCDDTDSSIGSNVNDSDCDGVPTGEDCNDNDATVTTSNINDGDCDGVPTAEDCDDTDSSIGSNVNDADCDGVPTGEDCNDGDATVTTSNINDADCDGVPTAEDCDDNDASITNINIGDEDCDGYLTANDCDDSNPGINPGATEICGNNLDDNCDGFVDEGCDTCIDTDSDGICDSDDICPALANPAQEPDKDCDGIPTAVDCNDNDATVLTRLDVDSDGDGVADCNDQEINSPCPLLVDRKGISIDTDNDGTPNCEDACPNDRNSVLAPCPCTSTRDSDADGVVDCFDLELRSPCPVDVDVNGVSNDDDRDGVPNCEDVCPEGDDKIDVDRDKVPDACDLSLDVRGEPICHIGNNGTSKTIFVSPQQKARHLSHGDSEGACETNLQAQSFKIGSTANEEELIIYPNPASGEINIQISEGLSADAVFTIRDLNGRRYVVIPLKGMDTFTVELDDRFIPGTYFATITVGAKNVSKQFVVMD